MPATEAGNLKIAQSGEERVQKVFWCMWAKSLPVAPVQLSFALVQNRVALVQKTLGRPFLQLAKTSSAPSPDHFGQCWGFGPLQQALWVATFAFTIDFDVLFLRAFQRPLTLMLLQEFRDRNGSRIVIQIGVYTTFCQEADIVLRKSIAIEMGGVSRYFSNVSGSKQNFPGRW